MPNSNPTCYNNITGAYPAFKIPALAPYNYVPTPKNYCFCTLLLGNFGI